MSVLQEAHVKSLTLTLQNLVCNMCPKRINTRSKILLKEHDLKKTTIFVSEMFIEKQSVHQR